MSLHLSHEKYERLPPDTTTMLSGPARTAHEVLLHAIRLAVCSHTHVSSTAERGSIVCL